MTLFGITVTSSVIWIVLGVIAAIAGVWFVGGRGKRRISRAAGTLADIGALVSAAREAAQNENDDETTPRSLSRGDSLYLPMIEKDFPDFSLNAAKEQVRAHVRELFGGADAFRVHNTAIGDYLRSGSEKTVVFQCAYEVRENGKLRQHRVLVDYTNKQLAGEDYVAQTCPACGAAIRAGSTECAYCGSRLVMTRAAWEITDCREG